MLPLFTTGQLKDGIDTGDLMLDLSDYVKKKDAEKLATKSALSELEAVVAGKLDASPQHKHQIDDIKQLTEELNSKYDKSEKYSHNVILSDTEKIAFIESPKVTRLEVAMNQVADGYNFYVDDSNGDLMIVSPASILIATYSVASGTWSFGGVNVNEHQEVLENHTEALNAVCSATLVNIKDISESNTKIDEHITEATTSITNHQEVLENHTEALNAVCSATLVNINDITSNNTKINTVESIINEYISKTDAVLKNHYDALIILCQKHGMVDSNVNDTPNVTPN